MTWEELGALCRTEPTPREVQSESFFHLSPGKPFSLLF